MATTTCAYPEALDFIWQAKREDCLVPDPELPECLRSTPPIPYLGVGLGEVWKRYQSTGAWQTEYQVFASGWTKLEGVMITTPETEFDADLRVGIAAANERALRDLLLSFPRGQLGLFYCAADWMLDVLGDLLDGYAMPAREGYFATAGIFTPAQPHPALRLGDDDYDVVRDCWSRDVWDWVIEHDHRVHACLVEDELCALCFHWPVTEGRREVHGLQAVRDVDGGYAESAFSSATREVLESAEAATCTANLSSDREMLRVLRRLGYRPFYRVRSYLGVKRGSGYVPRTPPELFFRGRPTTQTQRSKALAPTAAPPALSGKKDPVVTEFRDLASLKGRLEQSRFTVEGPLLVSLAIRDGLPVERILFTPALLSDLEGIALLNCAHRESIPHFRVTEGLMGTATTTRPVPTVIAAVRMEWRAAEQMHLTSATSLLVVDGVANPSNLGMILRTADAAGVEGVLVLGDQASPYHKNCVKAARGAVGRIPLFHCEDPEAYLRRLVAGGFDILGASASARRAVYDLELRSPLAFVVGNEGEGVSKPVVDLCTELVKIPMAPGQESLNVAVATSILLYEYVRRRVSPSSRLGG